MPILEIIAVKAAEILGTYYVEKKLDKFFESKLELNNRLTQAIYNTIDQYSKDYPIEDQDGKHGFYKSQVIIDELLKYRVMVESYRIEDLYIAFDSEINIIPPERKDVERFYEIFIRNINADEKLRKIEIRETFDLEIFKISRKLDNLKRYVENILSQFNTQLEYEWKRQIDVYKIAFNNFKPKTSLELLIKLEESFLTSSNKPSKSIRAAIEYLKSQCYDFLGNRDEVYKCSINAYKLDPQSIIYLELACYSYTKLGEFEQAKILLENLLKEDEFNSIGWFIKIFTQSSTELEKLIEFVPDFVRKDKDFRRIIFYNIFINDKFSNQPEVFQKYSLISPISEYDASEISIRNFKDKIYWIESKLTEYTSNINFDFNSVKNGDNELCRFLKEISNQLLSKIADSEIKENYKTLEFFNKYFEFVINGNKEAVYEMNQIFPTLKIKQEPIPIILANSLQIIGENSKAIEIIESLEMPSKEILLLKAYCYYKTEDIDNYIKINKQILSSINIIDSNLIESILIIPTTLSFHNRINEIEDDQYFSGKDFEFPYLKVLLKSYLEVLKDKSKKGIVSEFQSIEDELLEKSSKLCFYISYSYFLLKDYSNSTRFFRRYVSKDSESRDLYYYILALKNESSNHKELLTLLAKWRKEFSFNEELIRMEADLRRQLSDWSNCLEICDYFLNKIALDEAFLTLELISLNELGEEKHLERIRTRVALFKSFEFRRYNHVQIVSSILFQHGFYKDALDILYQRAIDLGNKQARIDYFMLIVQVPPDFIKELEIVEIGSYVKYSINQEINFIQVEDNSELAQKLIGHRKGDIVTVQRPLISTIDSIVIVRIMDKYLYLHDQILEEVKNNPYSGLPMQSVEFPDVTPEGLKKTLISMLGASGTVIHDKQIAIWNDYYNFQISFSEIIIQLYSSDYIGGYYNLITFKEGITQVPLLYYPKKVLHEEDEFIIDFSSMFILFQISKEHNLKYPQKFIIGKGTLDFIRSYLKKEQFNKQKQMSLNVTLEGIHSSIITKKDNENNIKFLLELLQWIESNCIIKISESKLDILNKTEEALDNEVFANILLDNLTLLNESNESTIITDDSIYFKFYPLNSGKTISSEYYIKSFYPEENNILNEFIKYKYIGFTIAHDCIFNEFQKKNKDQYNLYAHCIGNTSLRLIPSIDTILTVVKFLKEVAINSFLSDEVFKQEAINAFVNLLKGQSNIKSIQITVRLINEEFCLLGPKLNLILESFENALQILRLQ